MKHHASIPVPWPVVLAGLLIVLAGSALAEIPGVHDVLDCDSCHMTLGSTKARTSSALIAEERCVSCHADTRSSEGLAKVFHAHGRGDCTSCHSFHHPDELKAGETTFAHAMGDDRVARHCVSCHAPDRRLDRLSDGHRAATVLYHGGKERLADLSPSEACLKCHARHDADPRVLAVSAEPPRFADHASHPYGTKVGLGRLTGGFRIRRRLDPRITLFDGAMECQSCHDVTGRGNDLLVQFEQRYDMCLGCHERQGDQGAMVASADESGGSGLRPFGMID